jgi:hypothetical protein
VVVVPALVLASYVIGWQCFLKKDAGQAGMTVICTLFVRIPAGYIIPNYAWHF